MTAHGGMPALYLSAPHACPYLPDRIATTLMIDPAFPVDTRLYGVLLQQGFRRSGDLFYRPHCRQCRQCVSVRIPVREFRPNRAQRRVLRRNADIEARRLAPCFRSEHFALYRHYQAKRHPHGSMDDPNPDKYRAFLVDSQVASEFIELRVAGHLLAVAVLDRMNDGLSAIYTYYEPDAAARSLGTFAVLWQIDYARRLGLDYLYLGYWIADCSKMRYKTNFEPLEGFEHGTWRQVHN